MNGIDLVFPLSFYNVLFGNHENGAVDGIDLSFPVSFYSVLPRFRKTYSADVAETMASSWFN